jgi:hypothetical protein
VLITDQAIYQSNMPFAAAMAVFLVLSASRSWRSRPVHPAGGGMNARWARRLFFAAVAAVLAAPIVVVAGVSLNEQRTLTFPPESASRSPGTATCSPIPAGAAGIASVTDRRACSAALAVPSLSRSPGSCGGGTRPWAPAAACSAWRRSSCRRSSPRSASWRSGRRRRSTASRGRCVISHAIFLVTLPLVTLSLGFLVDRPRGGRGGDDHGRRRPDGADDGRSCR